MVSRRLHPLGLSRWTVVPAALLAALATIALAAPAPAAESALEAAREESSVVDPPRSRHELPGGSLRVTSELVAGQSGQRVGVRVELDRPADGASLLVTLPSLWLREAPSGLPYALAPRLTRSAAGRAGLRRSGRTVSLALDDARPGDTVAFEVVNIGIPAGTYRLPYSWRDAAGSTVSRGEARIVLYAPTREPLAANLFARAPTASIETNVSNDGLDQGETFIVASPGNPDRFAASANGDSSVFVTDDGGRGGYTRITMPDAVNVPGNQMIGLVPAGDPTFAADALGNIWYSEITDPEQRPGQPGRIIVNRVAAGTRAFQPVSVGLPQRTSGLQDKQMMTIDNSPSSPTFGRLYMVWNEPADAGGINLVISQCDTRPGGSANAGNCDVADKWTQPVAVTPAEGSYIYADVAVGPDGRAFVTWWDFSAQNAIRGSVCDPGGADCATSPAWSAPQTIAILDTTENEPVPFSCPIVAQPGGRAGPSPQVDVDRSGGPENGRVYVTWGDLRAGSGTTRCGYDETNNDRRPPQPSHLTWDSFVASRRGGLPGGSNASSSAGTRLLVDGEGGGQGNSEEWFPWLAVDQATGRAWADFYSTREDASRATTTFYVRSVTPSGSGHTVGELIKVSPAASDFSTDPCCDNGNQYGDYTGIDAANGTVLPVWTDKRGGGDSEVFVATVTDTSGGTTTGGTTGTTGGTTTGGTTGTTGGTTTGGTTTGGTTTTTTSTTTSGTTTTTTSGTAATTGSQPPPPGTATTGAAAPVSPRAISSRVSATRRSTLVVFDISGALSVPSGSTCSGRVSLRIRAGSRTVASRVARIGGSCRYRTRIQVRRSRFGRARVANVLVSFTGGVGLLARRGTTRFVTLPRR